MTKVELVAVAANRDMALPNCCIKSLDEDAFKYESPMLTHDVLIFTGSGLMGREVADIRSSDIVGRTAMPSVNKPAAKILIVDDHPMMRDGLAIQISNEPDLAVCGEADDVAAALRLVDELNPDLVIIDISIR